MEHPVQSYLLNHSFQQLEDDHGVNCRFSSCGTKASLNYDNIMSKFGDKLAESCRGLIIRPSSHPSGIFHQLANEGWKNTVVGEVEIIAWPMNRFYNFEQTHEGVVAVKWDDPKFRIYEKLDGTMCVLYWDQLHQHWCIATRSVPNADLPIFGNGDILLHAGKTFSDLFFETLTSMFGDVHFSTLHEKFNLNKNITYVFELTTPINRVVVKYDIPKVTLLAARDLTTGREIEIEQHPIQYIPKAKTWELKSIDELHSFVNSSNPSECEGAVICDSNFNRQKIKNKAWLIASRAKDIVSLSKRTLLESIIDGTIDDVIPFIDHPVTLKLVVDMIFSVTDYFLDVNEKYRLYKSIAKENKAEFAKLVIASGEWSPVYFGLWKDTSGGSAGWVRNQLSKNMLHKGSLDAILSHLKYTKGETK